MKLFKDKENFGIYKNYICKLSQQESKNIDLNFEGWKMLIDESITEIVEDKLQMKYLGNGIWATDYDNHCRKMLELFIINNKYATFKWGWNFDFMPIEKNKKLVYAKNDKQAKLHIFEVSTDFYKNTPNREKTIVSSLGKELLNFDKTILEMKKSYVNAINYLLPIIKKYYENTGSYKKIIEDIENKLTNNYYSFINPEMKVVKVYIKAFLGNKEESKRELETISFKNEEIKKEYLLYLDNV